MDRPVETLAQVLVNAEIVQVRARKLAGHQSSAATSSLYHKNV